MDDFCSSDIWTSAHLDEFVFWHFFLNFLWIFLDISFFFLRIDLQALDLL
jgi:hypothetical protein